MAVQTPDKVLVTKIGLDGHDRGRRLVAGALRDAGIELVYTGPWQPIPAVVKLALEEDVDLVGISSLAGDHLLVPQLAEALATAGRGAVPIVVGGIVPDDDEALLLAAGVRRAFHPGRDLATIGGDVRELCAAVDATRDGLSQGEIVGGLREVPGFGQPRVVL